MHKIKEILASNTKYLLDNPIPSLAEINELELVIGSRPKDWYCDFVRLGGLNDLRFSANIMAPQALKNNQNYIPNKNYVTFASDGSGDLFCWCVGDSSAIYCWDHETGLITEVAPDFVTWLMQIRF